MNDRIYKLGRITVWLAASVAFMALGEGNASASAFVIAAIVTVLS